MVWLLVDDEKHDKLKNDNFTLSHASGYKSTHMMVRFCRRAPSVVRTGSSPVRPENTSTSQVANKLTLYNTNILFN